MCNAFGRTRCEIYRETLAFSGDTRPITVMPVARLLVRQTIAVEYHPQTTRPPLTLGGFPIA